MESNTINKHLQIIKYSLTFLLSFCIFYQVIAQDISTGLVAKYPFSGNPNDAIGTLNGINHGATLATDRFGNPNSAYSFDGTGVFIEIPDNDLLDFAYNENFSISLWVKIASSQNDMRGHNNEIMGKWNALNSTGYPYAIRYWNENATSENKNKIFNLRYDSESCAHNPLITGSCAISRDEWHHLAFVKNGSVLSYYQDGQLLGTTVDNTVTSCNTVNNNPIYIGKRDLNTRFFTGSIDDIAFYNRTLEPQDIVLLVNANGWTIPPPPTLDILSFTIPNQVSSQINYSTNSVDVLMPCNVDLSELAPTFTLSSGSSAYINNILQISSNSINDFNQPVKYYLKSDDSCNGNEWTVNVNSQTFTQEYINSETSFINFSIKDQIGATVYNQESHVINITIPCSSNISNLIANFTLPNNSTAFINDQQQFSNSTTNDYSDTVRYIIQNDKICSMQEWVVIVNFQLFTEDYIDAVTSFKEFSIDGQKGSTTINNSLHQIEVMMPCETDLSNLKSVFALENGSTAEINGVEQESDISVNSFTNPQTYTITAPDVCQSSTWDVQVVVETFDFETIDLYSESFFVPNVITPNLDKKNESFEIGTLLQGAHISIYNRHGIKVFETENYRDQFTGSKLTSGVYYYWIKSNCLEKPIIGPLNILK